MAELRAKMHHNRRRKMRMKVQQRNKKLKDWVENDQQGKAFKNVQKTVRDGAVEAATVRMADGKKRAAKNGAEVVEHHYEESQDWMGRKHRRWYYTAEGCLRGEEVAHDSGMERHVSTVAGE
jgi:aminoglycoside/choline kinase family phosphotransferase